MKKNDSPKDVVGKSVQKSAQKSESRGSSKSNSRSDSTSNSRGSSRGSSGESSFFKKIPNILSGFRIIVAILIFLFMKYFSHEFILVLFGLGALTDFFDGFLARKMNASSNLGEILDPIGDKLLINSIMWFLYQNLYIELIIFMLFLFRDTMIVIGGILLKILAKKKNSLANVSVRFIGKVSTFMHMFVCVHILVSQKVNITELYFVGVVVFISFLVYFIDFLRDMKRLKRLM